MPPRSKVPGRTARPTKGHIRCPSCLTTKPSDDFASNARQPSGKQSWCRACHAGYHRSALKWRKERGLTPEPRGRKNKPKPKRHVYWYPTLIKLKASSRNISKERKAAILIFLLFSTLTEKEIAWRTGVSHTTVITMWKRLKHMKPKRNYYHNGTLLVPGKRSRRVPPERALRDLRQLFRIPRQVVSNFLHLRQR